jgi:hypothetical protein
VSQLSTTSQLLQIILKVEREIVNELHLLMSMKVFPSTELVIIRKEMKAFRERLGAEKDTTNVDEGDNTAGISGEGGDASLESELTLAERKLAILRGRRMDEEDIRTLNKKKAARVKQLEESQSRDPLNFKNQSRF